MEESSFILFVLVLSDIIDISAKALCFHVLPWTLSQSLSWEWRELSKPASKPSPLGICNGWSLIVGFLCSFLKGSGGGKTAWRANNSSSVASPSSRLDVISPSKAKAVVPALELWQVTLGRPWSRQRSGCRPRCSRQQRVFSFNLKETECWLVRGARAVGRLCFGLEVTNHTRDPVQLKGSLKKKKKGKRKI